jgi:phosphoribosylformimino-5-aminoimidazole carboxamide ribotide isomerase
MTVFRPCIDLHAGQVKQIVGGTLKDTDEGLQTNHVSLHSAGYFGELYRKHGVKGAHVIMLGPGNTDAAREALQAWPGHLQIGGGITDQNALEWINAGAAKVCPISVSNYAGSLSKVGDNHIFPLPVWSLLPRKTGVGPLKSRR